VDLEAVEAKETARVGADAQNVKNIPETESKRCVLLKI
jgi:hypothetical protein